MKHKFSCYVLDIMSLFGVLFGRFICGWLCPFLSLNPSLRSGLGSLFNLKLSILIAIILLSIFIYRVFCKYLCPLGAFYSIFNPISFYKLEVDEEKCISCEICTKTCKMNVEIYKRPNDMECIRCNDCIKSCPKNAIRSRKSFNKK